MSNKFQKHFEIPDQLQGILNDFCKEVLRSQPTNVYEFGYKYFLDLAEKKNKESEKNAEKNGLKND